MSSVEQAPQLAEARQVRHVTQLTLWVLLAQANRSITEQTK
jgi:hypothetical protein